MRVLVSFFFYWSRWSLFHQTLKTLYWLIFQRVDLNSICFCFSKTKFNIFFLFIFYFGRGKYGYSWLLVVAKCCGIPHICSVNHDIWGVRFRCKHDSYMHKMIRTYGACEWEYAAEAKLMVTVGPNYEIAHINLSHIMLNTTGQKGVKS